MTTETVTTTATTGAAPATPHMTLTVPVLDWAERRAIREKVTRLGEELRSALRGDLARLVFEYGEACREDELVSELNMMDAMVEALAAHLPGQGVAIRCLARHALDTDFGHGVECGVVPERRDETA